MKKSYKEKIFCLWLACILLCMYNTSRSYLNGSIIMIIFFQ